MNVVLSLAKLPGMTYALCCVTSEEPSSVSWRPLLYVFKVSCEGTVNKGKGLENLAGKVFYCMFLFAILVVM